MIEVVNYVLAWLSDAQVGQLQAHMTASINIAASAFVLCVIHTCGLQVVRSHH